MRPPCDTVRTARVFAPRKSRANVQYRSWSAWTNLGLVSRCASCGIETSDEIGLCPHHQSVHGARDWAAANRIMCDFFHRQRVPRRLLEADRGDDVVTVTRSLDAEGAILLQVTYAAKA